MERKKLEQIILVVLLPIFLLGLLYMHSKKPKPGGALPQPAAPETGPLTEPGPEGISEPPEEFSAKYEVSVKDPLRDLLKLYIFKLKGEKPKEGYRQIPMPGLDIQGLIWDSDKPQAIINNKVVKMGDYIEGVKVVNIRKDGVVVEYEGEEVLIDRKGKGY